METTTSASAAASAPAPPSLSPPLPILSYAPSDRVDRRGKGPLCTAASILLPGLGHWIAGDRRRGVRWFIVLMGLALLGCACLAVPALVPVAPILGVVGFVLQVIQWVSAYRVGRSSDRRMFANALARYFVALLLIVIAIVLQTAQFIAWPLRWYVVEAFIMPTPSMSPTIAVRDRFLVHKLVTPKRWDIVAVRIGDPKAPNDVYCKRLIGFPGETIEIVGGKVKVNGTILNSPAGPLPYTSTVGGIPGGPVIRRSDGKPANGIEGHPITLGPDEYYFLGDNSPISGDSRYWDWSVDSHQPGTLGRDRIIGVATWRYWPLARWRKLR